MEQGNPANYDPNRVRPHMCAVCPHREGSPLASLVPKLIEVALTEANHFCHLEQTQGLDPTILCRGTRKLQIEFFTTLGVLDEPTDECWERTLKALQDSE